jgi:hypothetical protein
MHVPIEIERLHGDEPHRMQPETKETAIFVGQKCRADPGKTAGRLHGGRALPYLLGGTTPRYASLIPVRTKAAHQLPLAYPHPGRMWTEIISQYFAQYT